MLFIPLTVYKITWYTYITTSKTLEVDEQAAFFFFFWRFVNTVMLIQNFKHAVNFKTVIKYNITARVKLYLLANLDKFISTATEKYLYTLL